MCELAKSFGCGADADIASIPLKVQDLSPSEIWISETQERMLIAVPEATLAKVLSVFEREEIEASAFGKLTDSSTIVIRDREGELARIDFAFLFSPPLQRLGTKSYAGPKEEAAVYPRSFRKIT